MTPEFLRDAAYMLAAFALLGLVLLLAETVIEIAKERKGRM